MIAEEPGQLTAIRNDLGSATAIKVLRDAWLSPGRRDRFAAEQRTLAQLSHPSIAQLYNADSLPDGTPWFVMEYVEGLPLTDYCRGHDTSIEGAWSCSATRTLKAFWLFICPIRLFAARARTCDAWR